MDDKQEHHKKKLYFSIAEVANEIGEAKSLIRFWEKMIPQIRPSKSKTGIKIYTQKEFQNIVKIHHLIKKSGFTIEGAKKKLFSKETDIKKKQTINKLLEVKSLLENFLKT